jgi:hypothetical protein
LCGEHLSVDNMNRAIELAAEQLNIEIKEFTVAGINYGTLFAHQWYVGTDEPVDSVRLKTLIDEHLKDLNDDYRVERSAALKEILVEVLPSSVFQDYLRSRVKVGAASKFPRVLKYRDLEGWRECIAQAKK